MPLCLECKDKSCIKTGKPCKKVEKILKEETCGRRNWLTPTDPYILEKLAAKMEMKAKYGKKWANQNIDSENTF